MAFNQKQYINDFNKETYQMFPLRIRKDNSIVIQKLKNTRNKNRYVVTLIEKDVSPDVLTIKQIKERAFPVFKKHHINEIYLFGSYARGTQNAESDIDIAIKPNTNISKKQIFYLSQELEEKIKTEVDLINLDDINDSFRYEILINGKTIYCRDELKFELYKLDMYREYLELNESRQIIIDRIKKGNSIYGEQSGNNK